MAAADGARRESNGIDDGEQSSSAIWSPPAPDPFPAAADGCGARKRSQESEPERGSLR